MTNYNGSIFLCLNFKKAKSEDFKHEYEKTVKQEMKRPQKANKEGIKRCLNKKTPFISLQIVLQDL